MRKKVKKKVTDAEHAEAGRVMVKAALEALGKRLGEYPGDHAPDDWDQDRMARRVVMAVAAAQEACWAEQKRLSEVKGDQVFLNAEPNEAVATAFWMWSFAPDLDVSEVDASSIAGSYLLALVQGISAARAMTEALHLLQGSIFDFVGEGAVYLSQNDRLRG